MPSTTSSSTTTIQFESDPIAIKGDISLKETYVKAIMELEEIFTIFGNEEDDLSEEMRNFVLDMLNLFPADAVLLDDFDEFVDQRLDRAQELFLGLKTILCNNLDHHFPIVKEPYYDGKYVWEKETYESCKRAMPQGLSPYTLKPYEALPHPFAKAILNWAKSLHENFIYHIVEVELDSEPSSIPVEIQSALQQLSHPFKGYQHPIQVFGKPSPDILMCYYLDLAGKANAKGLEVFALAAKKIARESNDRPFRQENLYLQETAKLQERLDQQKEMIADLISNLSNQYEATKNALQTKIDFSQKELEGEKQIHQGMREQLSSLEGQLNSNLSEQGVMQERFLQEKRERETAHETAVNEFRSQIAEEKSRGNQNLALIQQLELQIEQAVSSQERREEEQQQAIHNIERTIQIQRQQIEAEQNLARQQQGHVQSLNQKLEASQKQQIDLEKRHQQQQNELQTTLRSEMSQQVTAHAAERQRLAERHLTELALLQQKYQADIALKISEISQNNLIKQNGLQAQINGLQNEKSQLVTQTSNLSVRLNQQTIINSQNNQRITNLLQQIQNQVNTVAHLKHKVKKKKWYKFKL